MSEHDELADRSEAELNYLEAAAERNEDRAEEARDMLQQAQRDELTPEALGEDDPARREPSEAERLQDEDEANAPPPPKSPGEKVDASLASSDEPEAS